MAQSSFRPVFIADSSSPPPAKFSYPPRRPYGVRLNRVRPVRRRRSWHCSTDLYMILFPLLCFLLLFIGSLWVMLGFYAPENVDFGRNVSHLFKANSLFVRRIKITNELQNQGLVIYGLPKIPVLDKQVTWAEAYDVTVLNGGLQEWDFWLNVGSEVTVQYNSSDTKQELIFVVVEGEEKMQKWLKNPNNIDMASSWQAVQGTGDFQYRVQMDQKYLFSFLNPNSENAEVRVNITVKGTLHGTDDYKSKCTSTTCEVCLDFLGSDVLLLTTETFQVIEHRNSVMPSRLLQQDNYYWSVNVTFEQRWLTYMVFWGAMGLIMLILYIFCRPLIQESEASQQNPEPSLEGPTIPVVFEVDNKVSKSLQSEALPALSADLDLQDPEAVEDFMCIICFDQRRNCFFDPCGHCATCYSCSMKILKDKKATCPLCRQQVRVVRKLFLR